MTMCQCECFIEIVLVHVLHEQQVVNCLQVACVVLVALCVQKCLVSSYYLR